MSKDKKIASGDEHESRIESVRAELRAHERTVDGYIDSFLADADMAERSSKLLDDHRLVPPEVSGWLNGYAAAMRAAAEKLPDSREAPF